MVEPPTGYAGLPRTLQPEAGAFFCEAETEGTEFMKLIVKAAAVGFAVLALGACNKHSAAGDNVVSNADATADNIEAAAQNTASNITAAADNKADAVRAAGENKADKMDNMAKAGNASTATTNTTTTKTETKKK